MSACGDRTGERRMVPVCSSIMAEANDVWTKIRFDESYSRWSEIGWKYRTRSLHEPRRRSREVSCRYSWASTPRICVFPDVFATTRWRTRPCFVDECTHDRTSGPAVLAAKVFACRCVDFSLFTGLSGRNSERNRKILFRIYFVSSPSARANVTTAFRSSCSVNAAKPRTRPRRSRRRRA